MTPNNSCDTHIFISFGQKKKRTQIFPTYIRNTNYVLISHLRLILVVVQKTSYR